MKNWLLILFVVMFWSVSKAQDPQFSQFYAAPMYLNPALTGNTTQGRFVGNYRNQWPAIPKAYVSYAFSYDHNISDYNSGVGIIFVHDKAGVGGLKYNSVGGLYSYQLRLDRKHVFRPGVRASYIWRGLDASQLVFPGQLSAGSASNVPSNVIQSASYLDVAAGFIFYSKDYWIGYAVDHLNQPDQSLIVGGSTKLPAKHSLHAGYNFPVQKSVKGRAKSTLTVAANYKAQLKWDQFDLGAYYTQMPLVIGLWYRGIPFFKAYQKGYANNESIIALVGLHTNSGFRIGYSYDLTISRLISNTGGAHEISIQYEYATAQKRKKKRKQKFLVPCAKF